MKERSRVESYLRREDTPLAHTLKFLSPHEGDAYRAGKRKHFVDTALAIPLFVASLPVTASLAAVKALEDRGNPFYVQSRYGKDGEQVRIVKIRTMIQNAHDKIDDHHAQISKEGDIADPRITRVGRVLRSTDLDELPQLGYVAAGQMSLVGIRMIPEYAQRSIEERSTQPKFSRWRSAYAVGRPGLFSLNSAYSENKKNERMRVEYDMLYANRASLGLDMLILYKHGERVVKKLQKKLKSFLRS